MEGETKMVMATEMEMEVKVKGRNDDISITNLLAGTLMAGSCAMTQLFAVIFMLWNVMDLMLKLEYCQSVLEICVNQSMVGKLKR